MTDKRKHALRAAVAVGALLAACTDARHVPSAPEPPPDGGPTILSRGGVQVPEAQMRALLRQVTREVAVALADDGLRRQVYDGLHASPYREHKLHFGTFLRGEARPLLAAMAAARSATPGARAPSTTATTDAVLAMLDSIVDLEFYMPVKEHFAAWRGGANLIVASGLRDDGRTPDGFDLSGRVAILSAAAPPPTPTLVLVFVETDFTRIPTPVGPQAVSDVTSVVDGVYMTTERVYGDYEGWLYGSPEYEVHLFSTDIDAHYVDRVCAGGDQTGLYYYDADNTWTGSEVLVATEARFNQEENVQFQVWEDDSGPCTGLTGGIPPKPSSATPGQMATWESAIVSVLISTGPGQFIAALNAIPATYTFLNNWNTDALVGVMSLANTCWQSATGPQLFYLRSPEGSHPQTGWATLDFRFDHVRDPICTPTPPPPYPVASLSGPSAVQPYSTCVYSASVNGGTSPYSYAWTVDGAPVGDNSSSYWHSIGESSFTVGVTVTDANGEVDSKTLFVSIDTGAAFC